MTRSIIDNPNLYARTAGAIYLVVIVFGGFSEGFVAGQIIVPKDLAATAQHILTSSALWSFSLAGNLLVPLIAVAQLWIEYLLLRPVSRNLALLFVLFNLVSLAVESVSKIFQILTVTLLNNHAISNAFPTRELNSLVGISLEIHNIAFNIALLYFGCACLVSGYLYGKATYFPTFVGAALQIAGGCYLIASASALFAPKISDAITPWILLPCLLGEATACLWLLIKGVDVANWRAAVSGQGALLVEPAVVENPS